MRFAVEYGRMASRQCGCEGPSDLFAGVEYSMGWLARISIGKWSSKLAVPSPKPTEEQTREAKRRRQDTVGQAVLSLIFFMLLFLYLWLVVDLRLLYSIGATRSFPVFFKGWTFFREQILHAGGAVTYVSALLSQFFHYAWAGALVVTLQAWLLAACTGYLLRAAGVPGWRWLRFAPPLLVLAAYNRYSYHFPTTMALLTALLFACLYVALISRSPGSPRHQEKMPGSFDGRAIALFLGLSIIVYPAAAGAYLLFGVLCALYELFRRSIRVGWLMLAVVLILPYAAAWVFDGRVVDAYTELLPVSWKILISRTQTHMIGTVYALYLLPPVAMLVGGLSGRLRRRFRAARVEVKPERTRVPNLPSTVRRPPWHRLLRPSVKWAFQSLVILGLGATLSVVSHDDGQKTLLTVHYCACHEMWPQVLQAATHQATDPLVLSAVNRALYHTGRLATDMFTYPQRPDGLLPTGDDQVLVGWHKFDTLIDLGLLNLAEKNLTECMETFGVHPMILQRLALINMARGKTDTARVFLGALDRTLFYSAWARHYLTLLQSDPALSTDARIQQMRAVCLRTDSTASFFDKEKMLIALLNDNGHNRMAFEYLMAWYLVTKQVGKVAEGIRYMDALGYTEIPPLYQEAICVYVYGQRKPVPLPGRTISPQVRQRIEQFSQIFNHYGRDKRAAFPELAAKYAGSYFLYHVYGLTSLE